MLKKQLTLAFTPIFINRVEYILQYLIRDISNILEKDYVLTYRTINRFAAKMERDWLAVKSTKPSTILKLLIEAEQILDVVGSLDKLINAVLTYDDATLHGQTYFNLLGKEGAVTLDTPAKPLVKALFGQVYLLLTLMGAGKDLDLSSYSNLQQKIKSLFGQNYLLHLATDTTKDFNLSSYSNLHRVSVDGFTGFIHSDTLGDILGHFGYFHGSNGAFLLNPFAFNSQLYTLKKEEEGVFAPFLDNNLLGRFISPAISLFKLNYAINNMNNALEDAYRIGFLDFNIKEKATDRNEFYAAHSSSSRSNDVVLTDSVGFDFVPVDTKGEQLLAITNIFSINDINLFEFTNSTVSKELRSSYDEVFESKSTTDFAPGSSFVLTSADIAESDKGSLNNETTVGEREDGNKNAVLELLDKIKSEIEKDSELKSIYRLMEIRFGQEVLSDVIEFIASETFRVTYSNTIPVVLAESIKEHIQGNNNEIIEAETFTNIAEVIDNDFYVSDTVINSYKFNTHGMIEVNRIELSCDGDIRVYAKTNLIEEASDANIDDMNVAHNNVANKLLEASVQEFLTLQRPDTAFYVFNKILEGASSAIHQNNVDPSEYRQASLATDSFRFYQSFMETATFKDREEKIKVDSILQAIAQEKHHDFWFDPPSYGNKKYSYSELQQELYTAYVLKEREYNFSVSESTFAVIKLKENTGIVSDQIAVNGYDKSKDVAPNYSITALVKLKDGYQIIDTADKAIVHDKQSFAAAGSIDWVSLDYKSLQTDAQESKEAVHYKNSALGIVFYSDQAHIENVASLALVDTPLSGDMRSRALDLDVVEQKIFSLKFSALETADENAVLATGFDFSLDASVKNVISSNYMWTDYSYYLLRLNHAQRYNISIDRQDSIFLEPPPTVNLGVPTISTDIISTVALEKIREDNFVLMTDFEQYTNTSSDWQTTITLVVLPSFYKDSSLSILHFSTSVIYASDSSDATQDQEMKTNFFDARLVTNIVPDYFAGLSDLGEKTRIEPETLMPINDLGITAKVEPETLAIQSEFGVQALIDLDRPFMRNGFGAESKIDFETLALTNEFGKESQLDFGILTCLNDFGLGSKVDLSSFAGLNNFGLESQVDYEVLASGSGREEELIFDFPHLFKSTNKANDVIIPDEQTAKYSVIESELIFDLHNLGKISEIEEKLRIDYPNFAVNQDTGYGLIIDSYKENPILSLDILELSTEYLDYAKKQRKRFKAKEDKPEFSNKQKKVLKAKLPETLEADRLNKRLKAKLDLDDGATHRSSPPPWVPPDEYQPPKYPVAPPEEPTKRKIWVIQGKLASWNIWNWKKTR